MLGVTAATIVGLAMLCFSIGMAHIFYRSKRKRWQAVLAWTLGTLAMVVLGESLRPVLGNRSGQFTGFLAVFVYLYLFDVPVKQRFFTYFMVDTAMYLTALLARYTVLLVCGFWPVFNPRTAFVILYFLLTGAVVFLFLRFLRTPIVERLVQFGEHLGTLTAFACTGYVVMLLLFDAWAIRDGLPLGEYVVMLLYVAVLGCGYYLCFVTMTAVRDNALAKAQVQELTAQARQAEQYYVTLAGHIQEIRQMQHDSRHHLRVLSGYARDGAYDQMEAYLSTLIEQSPDVGDFFYCANYTANILLGFYAGRARSGGIAFQCDAQIPADLDCAPVDLCAVLGNALQNALDACALQTGGERRYISLLARMVGHNLTLEVKNSYDGLAVERDGQYVTRKEGMGHGLGLASIRRVAKLYHGYCRLSRTEREFTLRVVLTL
ncbi:sensor histidine kinase [uncultured Oscillibacter sp.]|uniref:sensor histidine kinase n=1 Tax=uncultured Oscillibacter sp. TaxID=876091 RepID=UPI0025D7BDB2|nr:GHKL domain-containing protein [uncultured Oscillibacter sp.]